MTYEVLHRELVARESPPFESCHASTLTLLPGGDVLAAWFAGTKEGHPDVDIWLSRRSGGQWSKPKIIAGEEGIPHWNPVLFTTNNGDVFLFYKKGHKIPSWFTMVMQSNDNGSTWSEPKELVPGDVGGRGPVRNKPIVRTDGAWLAPASVEDDYWDAFVDISADGGGSWTMSRYVPIRHDSPRQQSLPPTDIPVTESSLRGKGIIQPTLWESAPGNIHMLLRSTEGWIFRSDSVDGGMTWSPAYPTELPNNNSGIDVAQLNDGTLALVYNPVQGNWAARSPLVIRLSRDNGASWTDEFILEKDEGEYSYPAIVAGDRNDIRITYTWNRKNIVYWHLFVR